LPRRLHQHAAGICGNDDFGQTSAWYVFTALVFIPWLRSVAFSFWAAARDKATLQLDPKSPRAFLHVVAKNNPTKIPTSIGHAQQQALHTELDFIRRHRCRRQTGATMGPTR